jgi:hypothetical protein
MDAKVWCYRFICPKPGTLGAYLGEKRPENGPITRNATELVNGQLARPNFNRVRQLVRPSYVVIDVI